MTETYYLNGNILPTIPVPHDCVINRIRLENQYIIFEFENDISYHDSVKNYSKPEPKSLIIKYHLLNDRDFSIYKWKKPFKFSKKNGRYDCMDDNTITKLSDSRLEYLYHYVGYRSIIIELFSNSSIILAAYVDYIKFEWIY